MSHIDADDELFAAIAGKLHFKLTVQAGEVANSTAKVKVVFAAGIFGERIELVDVGLASLTNLDQLPPTGAVVIAAPLKIVNGSGSPQRVIAFVPAE